MQLALIQFIQTHSDWEKLLAEKPYCLKISRDVFAGKNLVMFKYSQIDSDFSNEIVKESRGIILEEGTWEIISYPFRKFMNYGEPTADEIDWDSASVQEKVDGSLIKIVNLGGGTLLISTNGTIDALKAGITEQIGCKFNSFGEIVDSILTDKLGLNYGKNFPEGFTFMFELVSPWTRVVIPYKKADLYFLGYRDNKTLQEHSRDESIFSSWFPVPKVFSFGSFEDCIESTKKLPWDEEGYVVVDKDFHRVKVKSLAYLQVHHIKDNGNLSYARCLELIRLNEIGEVLNYFPEYKPEIDSLKEKYDAVVKNAEESWEELSKVFDIQNTPRKDLALWILSHFKISAVAFCMLDKKVQSVGEWFEKCSIDSLVKMLGLKQPKSIEE